MGPMSVSARSEERAPTLRWAPLLFAKYREGRKTHTADLRGPEWEAPPPAITAISGMLLDQKRLWKERRIDVGLRDGEPVWLRIVREYDGGETGTLFIPWPDVIAVEYKGDALADADLALPLPA